MEIGGELIHLPVQPVSHVLPQVHELIVLDCPSLVPVEHADLFDGVEREHEMGVAAMPATYEEAHSLRIEWFPCAIAEGSLQLSGIDFAGSVPVYLSKNLTGTMG